jgi:hypothetical protein
MAEISYFFRLKLSSLAPPDLAARASDRAVATIRTLLKLLLRTAQA